MLGAWGGVHGVRLQPLVDALHQEFLQQGVLHADETPVQMLCATASTAVTLGDRRFSITSLVNQLIPREPRPSPCELSRLGVVALPLGRFSPVYDSLLHN